MDNGELILKLQNGWITKGELCQMLCANERAVRDRLAELDTTLREHGLCILATSSRAGYHIPSHFNEEDLAMAHHIHNELHAKANSIHDRVKSINLYLQYAESAKEAKNYEQLTLF